MKPTFGSRAPQECVIDSPESLRAFERTMRMRVDREPPLTLEERKLAAAPFVVALVEWAGEIGKEAEL